MELTVKKCLSHIKWRKEEYYIEDFIRQYPLPQIVRITKGQYSTLGSSDSESSPNQYVLLVEHTKQVKFSAHCIKIKNKDHILTVAEKICLPVDYEGLFELLPQDGKSVENVPSNATFIEQVTDFYSRGIERCLVKESFRTFHGKDDNSRITSKLLKIAAGDILMITSNHFTISKKNIHCVQCLTSNGATVYIDFEQRIKITPIVNENHLMGLHTLQNLMGMKFPLNARMVHGKPLKGLLKTFFTKEIRLYSPYEEECVAILPIDKNAEIIKVPPSASLKVQAPKNMDEIMHLSYVMSLVDKAQYQYHEASKEIQIFDVAISMEHQNMNTCKLPKEFKQIKLQDISRENVEKGPEVQRSHEAKQAVNSSTFVKGQKQSFKTKHSEQVPLKLPAVFSRQRRRDESFVSFAGQNEEVSFSPNGGTKNTCHTYENYPKYFLSHGLSNSKKSFPLGDENKWNLKEQYTRDLACNKKDTIEFKSIKNLIKKFSIFKSQSNLASSSSNMKNTEQKTSRNLEYNRMQRSRSVADMLWEDI